MIYRRTVYVLALLGALAFYWAYREWLSWFSLMLILLLPWFSLLVSLPAMLTCRARILCPDKVNRGSQAVLRWEGLGTIPMPRLTGYLVVENQLTGKKHKLSSGQALPTQHCGALSVRLHRPKCQDYLGLFRLPVTKRDETAVLVRPLPLAPEKVPDLSRFQAGTWQPKPGGGFSENHELRLYRPGDSLKQVHWKLSAKTGQLITREPMEPKQSQLLLTMELRGKAGELDEKLGRLLWMSMYLHDCRLPHRILCLTGKGVAAFPVSTPEDPLRAIDSLLRAPTAGKETPTYPAATWRYHIGGDGHE